MSSNFNLPSRRGRLTREMVTWSENTFKKCTLGNHTTCKNIAMQKLQFYKMSVARCSQQSNWVLSRGSLAHSSCQVNRRNVSLTSGEKRRPFHNPPHLKLKQSLNLTLLTVAVVGTRFLRNLIRQMPLVIFLVPLKLTKARQNVGTKLHRGAVILAI